MEIDKNKWDKLIEEHYLSCLKIRPNDYELKHSREEMRDWWYSMLNRVPESNVEGFILGKTHANNNGYIYHPA